MSKKKQDNKVPAMLKIVYFDEETASDYLDITSGGKITATAEDIRSRSVELSNKFGTSLAAKLSWLPFLGASANIDIGGGGTASGNSLFKKTLSNTILTDYLSKTLEDLLYPNATTTFSTSNNSESDKECKYLLTLSVSLPLSI